MSRPSAPFSRLVLLTGAATLAVALATMGYGWLSGWSWPRVYAAIDRQVFLAGACLFLTGVLGGKPQPPPPPDVPGPDAQVEAGPRLPPEGTGSLGDPFSSELRGRHQDRPELSELDALDRLRQRAGSLALGGLLLIAWTVALHGARPLLGALYGATP